MPNVPARPHAFKKKGVNMDLIEEINTQLARLVSATGCPNCAIHLGAFDGISVTSDADSGL
jgi:hypothetical protein